MFRYIIRIMTLLYSNLNRLPFKCTMCLRVQTMSDRYLVVFVILFVLLLFSTRFSPFRMRFRYRCCRAFNCNFRAWECFGCGNKNNALRLFSFLANNWTRCTIGWICGLLEQGFFCCNLDAFLFDLYKFIDHSFFSYSFVFSQISFCIHSGNRSGYELHSHQTNYCI